MPHQRILRRKGFQGLLSEEPESRASGPCTWVEQEATFVPWVNWGSRTGEEMLSDAQ